MSGYQFSIYPSNSQNSIGAYGNEGEPSIGAWEYIIPAAGTYDNSVNNQPFIGAYPNINVDPDIGAYQANAWAASVRKPAPVSNDIGALGIDGSQNDIGAFQRYDPVVDVTVEAGVEQLTLTTFPATVDIDLQIDTNTEQLTLTTYQAHIDVAVEVGVQTEQLTLTTYPALVGSELVVTANTEALTLTAFPASVAVTPDTVVNANAEVLTLTTFPATIQTDLVITTQTEQLTLTTYPAEILGLPHIVNVARESLTLATFQASILPALIDGGDALPPSALLKWLLEPHVLVSGWDIHIGTMPHKPDRAIAISDQIGAEPNPKYLLDFPRCQVLVRGNANGYLDTYRESKTVKELLLGVQSQDINNDRLVSVVISGDHAFIGRDENMRPLFSLNFDLIVEPQGTVSSNRVEL
jgi:hypothetical protein